MVSTLYFWLVLAVVLLTASNGEPRINQPTGPINVSTRSSTSRGDLSGCHQVGAYNINFIDRYKVSILEIVSNT